MNLLKFYFNKTSIIIISIFFAFCSLFFLFDDLKQLIINKNQFNKYKIFNNGNYYFNNNFITHQLINIDYINKISTLKNKNKAIYNVNNFLNSVKNTCKYDKTDIGKLSYIKCANVILHKNFYYKAGIEVSNNYAIHTSDCDANSYLILDALSLVNDIDCYIIYSPFHAFLCWKDKFNNLQFWETTTNNNVGKKADLKDSFYIKTFDSFYYKPVGKKVILNIYKSLIYKIRKNKNKLKDLWLKYKSNSIISDVYYSDLANDNKISNILANEIESSLSTDISSVDKLYSLSMYYAKNNNISKSKMYFDMINKKYCSFDCYQLGVKLNIFGYKQFKNFFILYSNFLIKNGIYVNTFNFWLGIFFMFFSIFLFVIGFFKKIN